MCCSSNLQAQLEDSILFKIDSALLRYNTDEAFILLGCKFEAPKDSITILKYKIRELHALEQLELYDETINLSNVLLSKFQPNIEQKVEIYLIKALVYEKIDIYDKANEALRSSSHLIRKSLYPINPESKLIGEYYIRKSSFNRILYNATGIESQFETYLEYAKSALEFSIKNNNHNIRADANMILSFNPKLTNKQKERFQKNALAWWKVTGDIHGIANMYSNLTMVYIGNPMLALRYNDSAIMSIKGRNLPMTSANIYLTRYNLFKAMKNSDSALVNYVRHKNLYDDVEMYRKEINIARINRKALLDDQKLKNHILKDVIIKGEGRNLFLIVVILSLFIISIIFIYLFINISSKKKKIFLSKKSITENLEEKSILLTELNHRVKNNLSLILSLMHLQRDSNKRGEKDWDQLESRIQTMAMAHSLYSYTSNNIKGATIDLKAYLKAITCSYENLNQKAITFDLKVSSEDVSVENALPIGIILNELVSNSIKHAKVEGGNLKIAFHVTLIDNIFELFYEDNGSYFNENSKESTGNFILKALTKQLKGTISRVKSKYKITLYKK